MKPFAYAPTEVEITHLANLTGMEGWDVFTQIMRESFNQVAVQAIDELEQPGARPPAYYKGYMDSIRETMERVDYLIQQLKTERQAESDAERFAPARPYASSGDTAS